MQNIAGFSQYKVSRNGKIYSQRTKRFLNLYVGDVGYYCVCLQSDNGKQCSRRVHRIVAEHFIANPKQLPCVNHIDGNKLNNKASNLEWCSYKENTQHSRDVLGNNTNPPTLKGEDSPKSKLNKAKVKNVFLLSVNGTSQSAIARKYKVSHSTINNILHRRTWRHVKIILETTKE